ncbi:MAG: flagellar protein FlgT [Idiomarinaceae bacterium HL-53]|nr:MAG: flagellar protein FlgT [Idiomarinaceae bacterium HL-53]CUS47221.1 Flagellar assembly protein T, N-terminal domain [Idiomarinaceae bacterium HL-53]
MWHKLQKRMGFLLLLPLFIVSFSTVAADWYETQGWAPIINGDLEAARAKAIENALRQSLDLAGGQVESVEEVVDGVITGQTIQWRSRSSIEHVELVRERTTGQRHEVVLRTLVSPQAAQCSGAQLKPSVVLTAFEVVDPSQLHYGQIQDLTQSSAFRFSRLLGQHSRKLHLEHLLQAHQGTVSRLRGSDSTELSEWAQRVAFEHDGQYVITGVFHDLTAQPVSGKNLLFWRHPNYERNFELSLYLIDGNNGEVVTTASISGKAPWRFAYNEAVDVRGEAFWQSPFGEQLESRMRDVVYGFDQKLQCEPLKGLVVRANADQVAINLGTRHAITEGAEAQILHRGGFFDAQGHYREQWVVNPSEFVVSQVQPSGSILTTQDNDAIMSIQVRDMVIFK